MKRLKLKFKKLLNEYRSLYYELEYVQDVVNETHEEFDENLRQYCEKNEIVIEELQNKLKPKEQTETNLQLFRQVARSFHPDRLKEDDPERDEKEELFKIASKAIDEKNWGELFNIADRHDLDLGDYVEVNKSLSLDIKRMREKVKDEKRKYSWILHECEDSQICRDNVAKMFLKHVYGYQY
jgi:hypothetical protein